MLERLELRRLRAVYAVDDRVRVRLPRLCGPFGQVYPKAALLEIALEACAEVETIGLAPTPAPSMRTKRARRAIALAFRSRRCPMN